MNELSKKARPAPTAFFAAAAYEDAEPEPAPPGPSPFEREILSELRGLRTSVGRLHDAPDLGAEVEGLREAVERLTAPASKSPVAAAVRAAGIEGRYGADLVKAVGRALEGERETPLAIEEALREALRDRVRAGRWPLAWGADRTARRVIAVVGMSGVGKTTTLAKLAAHARIEGRTVALVSCDHFRVGGALQLERYAELLDASFHVARTQADIERIVEEETADLVFVDTCGRPPTTASPEMALRGVDVDKEIILCVPAAARACDAERAAQAFAPMRPTAIAVTKIDETAVPSAIAHGPMAARLPLAVLCFGPRVPEDVAPADEDDFAARLVPVRAAAPERVSTKTARPASTPPASKATKATKATKASTPPPAEEPIAIPKAPKAPAIAAAAPAAEEAPKRTRAKGKRKKITVHSTPPPAMTGTLPGLGDEEPVVREEAAE